MDMEMQRPIERKSKDEGYRFRAVSSAEGISAMENFQEAVVLFVGAERDAGATAEEIMRFCDSGGDAKKTLNIKTRTEGDERRGLESAASAMRQLYGADGWNILVRGYFQDALNAYDNVKAGAEQKKRNNIAA